MSSAEERFFMHTLTKRLERLEASVVKASVRAVRRFIVQGPASLPLDEALAFLRERGHIIREDDLNIVRIVISPDRTQPLALQDLTGRDHGESQI